MEVITGKEKLPALIMNLTAEPYKNIQEGEHSILLSLWAPFYEFVHSSPTYKESFIQVSVSVLERHEKLHGTFDEDTRVSVSLCLLHDHNAIKSSLSWNDGID